MITLLGKMKKSASMTSLRQLHFAGISNSKTLHGFGRAALRGFPWHTEAQD
ncbi:MULTISPECIES: hypothetical protein [Xanthomonas]|uniref:hypothetical protein n=1 Tax=Xanthomonas TaxID=338 RepID=UPI0019CFA1C5|nr:MULTISPECIES: hypothetical protein [Xanthomonas]WLA18018.1 hypothetical protein NDK37_11955 [Xanthomonas citri pv. glycines]